MKTLSILISLVLFSLLAGCENSTAPETEGVQVPVSTDYLADQLGDKNGTASQEEINFLTDYFQSNSEMWIITNCMARALRQFGSCRFRKKIVHRSK